MPTLLCKNERVGEHREPATWQGAKHNTTVPCLSQQGCNRRSNNQQRTTTPSKAERVATFASPARVPVPLTAICVVQASSVGFRGSVPPSTQGVLLRTIILRCSSRVYSCAMKQLLGWCCCFVALYLPVAMASARFCPLKREQEAFGVLDKGESKQRACKLAG